MVTNAYILKIYNFWEFFVMTSYSRPPSENGGQTETEVHLSYFWEQEEVFCKILVKPVW